MGELATKKNPHRRHNGPNGQKTLAATYARDAGSVKMEVCALNASYVGLLNRVIGRTFTHKRRVRTHTHIHTQRMRSNTYGYDLSLSSEYKTFLQLTRSRW